MAIFDESTREFYCECGCREIITFDHSYVSGHQNRGKSFPGRVFSEEHKRRISEALTGRIRPFEECEAVSRGAMGHVVTEDTRRRISEAQVGKKLSEEHRKNISAARGLTNTRPNKPESMLFEFLNSDFPGEWMYTGDGCRGPIGSKTPDFLHTRHKIVVELFGSHWHSLDPDNSRSEESTISNYKKYGYKCFVVWFNSEDDVIAGYFELGRELKKCIVDLRKVEREVV